MKKVMSNVWKTINRKNISLDKRVLEALAEKYDIPKATRPDFFEKVLVCSQSVEQRQFLKKALRLMGLAIFQTIGYWWITAIALTVLFQQAKQESSLNLNNPAIMVTLIVLNILAVFALFYLSRPLDSPRTFEEELQVAEKQFKPIVDDFMSKEDG